MHCLYTKKALINVANSAFGMLTIYCSEKDLEGKRKRGSGVQRGRKLVEP